MSNVRAEKECESWVHLERKRHSRAESIAGDLHERGPDKGSSVGMAMCHIQSARGQPIGAKAIRGVKGDKDRC